MSLTMGKLFRMTLKTRLFLWWYRFFDRFAKIGQWFITHCDYEEDNLRDEHDTI